MKRLNFYFLLAFSCFVTVSCSEDDQVKSIVSGDYPVKEYALERNPSVNVWGAGMDFVNDETASEETDLDYKYLDETDDFAYDIKFYTVKAYYTDDNGDLASEGCPAMLLNPDVKAVQIGAGLDFFDSLTEITPEMQLSVVSEPTVDYAACINEDGYYDRTLLFAAIDQCVIGRSFRSNVLVIPDGMTEEEVQPVYLVKTAEGGYVKFMVHAFQGSGADKQKTIVRWQVISE